MEQSEQETAAFEIIEEAFGDIRGDSVAIALKLEEDGIHDYTAEDVAAILALIKDGWDMFHEIWAKAI